MATTQHLSATNIIVITAGLVAVGGTVVFLIHRHWDDEEKPLPPAKGTPKTLQPSPSARMRRGHARHDSAPMPSDVHPHAPVMQQHPASPLSAAAVHFRSARQQNMDDVSVLRSAALNPSLSSADREYARQALRSAGIMPPRPVHHAAPEAPWSSVDASLGPIAQVPGQLADRWAQSMATQPGGGYVPAMHTTPTTSPLPFHEDVHTPPPSHYPYHEDVHAPPISHDAVVQHGLASEAHDPSLHWTYVMHSRGLAAPGAPFLSIQQAQHALNVIQHAGLVENDVLDSNTAKALGVFQMAHGLPVTKIVDRETSSALVVTMADLAGVAHVEIAHPPAGPSSAHGPYGPHYWTNVAQQQGLVKPGDRVVTTAEAQHYLNVSNSELHLTEDGVLGQQTQHALEAFQLAHHLPITGTLDPETSNALVYAAFVAATPQFIAPGF